MSHKLIQNFEANRVQNSKFLDVLAKIYAGTIVQVRLKPLNSAKSQSFIGICISHRKKGVSTSLLLRNFISGEAVEYLIYPFSSNIEEINVVHYAKLDYRYRRAKLYYLRNRTPKESTIVLK